MEETLKFDLIRVVEEFVPRIIVDRKLSVDGDNYLQWRKTVEACESTREEVILYRASSRAVDR